MKRKEEVWLFYQKYGKRFISSTIDYDKMLIPFSVIYVYTWAINQVKQLYMRRSTMSKKLFAILLALVMLMGTTSSFAVADANVTAQTMDPVAYNGNLNYGFGGPVDLNIADEDKIIEMLKKEGKISPNATYEEARAIYVKYMQNAAMTNQAEKPSKMERDLKSKQNQKVKKYIFDKQTTDNNPKEVSVLVLLADFADYKHSSIQPGETSMYYADYSHQHYQDMIFGDNGYVGPSGENLISMKQYYAQQSGGSLNIKGAVAGWYTLPQTAAFYGAEKGSSHDANPRSAVAGALKLAAQDPSINFADFDKEDIYDLDGDGNYSEPDGIIDYLMVLHAGVGQEAGGGSQGSNAIWSHSWNLGGIYTIPGTNYSAYSYTIEPEDGATGVFAHEFGHNLGLPDEYDTQYTSSAGEPISFWSIMSSGSWGGTIGGAEPTGFSPYAKQIFQALYGGNWQNVIDINYENISNAGVRVNLRQASEGGQVVRVNLPDKTHELEVKPLNGLYSYWGGKADDLDNSMYTTVDVPSANNVKLAFKTWYQIEADYDYASVIVREAGTENWSTLEGNITTTDDPTGQNPGNGINGSSGGIVDAEFDLSAYAGKKIELG
ncbi:MAG: family metalloprotease protein, partial [Clostridia bacterium]|nr:family metalloprotease protein [Clostridia bacterium]